MTSSFVVLAPGTVFAAGPAVLAADRVVVAAITPSTSTSPVDGALRGPDSQALVTAVAWPYESDGYVAGSGQRLVAFTVQLMEPTSDATGFTSTGPTLALAIDGSPEPLDTTAIFDAVGSSTTGAATGTGTESYVASVPNDTTSVELSMTDSGYTQSFSLWTLTRTTPAPAILYADPIASGITEQLGITKDVTLRDPSFGSNVARVFIQSAELSAFNPAGGDTPAPNGHAYLVLDMVANMTNGEYYADNYLLNLTAIPGRAVTFTSGHHRYVAMRSNAHQPDLSTSDDGMLDATYAFLVPSDTRRGVVSIGPTTTSGQTYLGYLNSGPFDTVSVSGPTRFSVGFPRPRPTLHQPTPPWVGEPAPATGLPTKRGHAPGGGLPILAALLALAAAVALVLVTRRLRAHGTEPEGEEETSSTPAPTTSVPADPAVPSEPSTLRIELMGAIRITPLKEPPSEFARAFLTYLALHDDRPRSVDDAQTALWPLADAESDVKRKTFLNHVSHVRRQVTAAHLPGNPKRSGYRLCDVAVDWHEFRDLAKRATTASPVEASVLRSHALRLVRGVPFESELAKWFQWTDTEGLRTAITRSVVHVAVDAHAERVQAGDLDGAEWALRQGLRCDPTELALWSCLADVVQARDERGDTERFWRDARAALDAGAVGQLEARVRG
jgi:DNA-binding SARP family transcriptional activator